MTVLGEADPMPMGRQFIGPVATIDNDDDDDDDDDEAEADGVEEEWSTSVKTLLDLLPPPRNDDGWNANVCPAVKRNVAHESFIIVQVK